ncbi:MAG: ATP-binding protein [Paracoccaceae bacterium]
MATFDAALLDFIEHPVFVLEAGGDGLPRYMAFNECACRSLNKPVNEILGMTASELYTGRLGQIAFEHHCESLKSGAQRAYDIQLPFADGQRLIRTSLRPVCDSSGNVIRIIGSSQDISGKQIFREMQAEVETIESEMEEFISLAAHDLRTPINNVTMVAEMLREEFQDLGDGKLELIGILEELGEKAMRLIGDVLAHAQATSVTEQIVEFEFGPLVQEIMALLDPMSRCIVELENGLIQGDRTATQIIIRNLVDNAIKYSSTQGPDSEAPADDFQLRLNFGLVTLDNGFFAINVQDNGIGFSDPALMFLDGGKLSTDSGFGLLGIKRLIHARGGTLTVANRTSANGADIAFSLPGSVEPMATDGTAEV